MKKWLYLAAVIGTIGILARLPHPAKDISRLEPVQLVYVYEEAGLLRIETDTDCRGTGRTLSEAASDLRARADGEVFLETAEFLLLDPDVPVTPDLFTLLHPSCKVFFTRQSPDLAGSAKYLSAHPPSIILADLRGMYHAPPP